MSRKALSKHSKKNHPLLTHLCKVAKVGNADIARLFDCTEVMVVRYMQYPYQLTIQKIILLAGLLSVSPEYLLYCIRFNNTHQNTAQQTINESFDNYKIKFGI